MSHDPAKRRKNLRKHNVDLPGCMEAFDGPMLTREDDRAAATALERRVTRIQAQPPLGTLGAMTAQAVLLKDGLDVSVEIHKPGGRRWKGMGGRDAGISQQDRNEEQWRPRRPRHPCFTPRPLPMSVR